MRVPKTLTKDKLLKFVYKVALLPRERGQVDSALNELIDEAEILFDFDPLWRVRRIKSRENPAIYEFTPTWDDAQGGVCPVVVGEVAKKDGGNK